MVILPGVRVNVQEPSAGNPFKVTLPVDIPEAGCVIVPINGGAGVAGCSGIVTLAESTEAQPFELVTV
jgi:hypothetical protein